MTAYLLLIQESAVTDRTNDMKTKRNPILLALVVICALLSISAVSVDRLKAHVTWLSDPAREGRYAGSAGAAAAAEYISQQMKELGCDVQMQEFGGRRKNVIGRVGTADRYIVLGAHYDGQGPGMPSASDNAAGVAVVLELVRELKTRSLPVSLVAVAFDDEEQGLNGSRFFVDHPVYPLEKAQAAIIFDTWAGSSWIYRHGQCSCWGRSTRRNFPPRFRNVHVQRCLWSARI